MLELTFATKSKNGRTSDSREGRKFLCRSKMILRLIMALSSLSASRVPKQIFMRSWENGRITSLCGSRLRISSTVFLSLCSSPSLNWGFVPASTLRNAGKKAFRKFRYSEVCTISIESLSSVASCNFSVVPKGMERFVESATESCHLGPPTGASFVRSWIGAVRIPSRTKLCHPFGSPPSKHRALSYDVRVSSPRTSDPSVLFASFSFLVPAVGLRELQIPLRRIGSRSFSRRAQPSQFGRTPHLDCHPRAFWRVLRSCW
eukprot:scaffold587_cov339-Pavlova_lutheri.AAC.12